jgi:hypothetical protein
LPLFRDDALAERIELAEAQPIAGVRVTVMVWRCLHRSGSPI